VDWKPIHYLQIAAGTVLKSFYSINASPAEFPPTPPTLLSLQGISLFSKKLGSGGTTGRVGRCWRIPGLCHAPDLKGGGQLHSARRPLNLVCVGLAVLWPFGPLARRSFGSLGRRTLGPGNQRTARPVKHGYRPASVARRELDAKERILLI
jgi:hypothetical protein